MKARALMKKIGTANGKPCSLVVVEETVAAQQGCQMFECTCGIKFWTQFYAAFHVKKAHSGEKPADRLKICCDLSLDLNVLASIYINVSDNIHTYLQGGEDETLKRKGEACDLESSPHAKRLSTADIRNRIPVTTPTKVQFPAKLVDTANTVFPAVHLSSSPFLSSPATRFSKIVDIPHPAFPAGHLSLSPAFSSATNCFSISPVPLLDPKLNNYPHSKDDNTWISCEPPTTPRLMQACNFSFKSTRPPNDTSSVQMKSADIRMKEHAEQDYRALSSSDQPLEDSSNNMFVDEETQRCKDNVQNGVENRGNQSSNEKSESSNQRVADADSLKYVLDVIAEQSGNIPESEQVDDASCRSGQKKYVHSTLIDDCKNMAPNKAEQDGNTPESEKVDDVSCRSLQQKAVLSTLIDDCKNMATNKIPAGELAVDDSIASSPFRAFQIPAITDGNFTATDNENGHLDDRSNCSDHDSRSGDHGIPQSIGRGKRKIIKKNCTTCINCKR